MGQRAGRKSEQPKINWEAYMTEEAGAMLSDRVIEKCVRGDINGNDIGAGFEKEWLQMLDINEFTVAEGTKERVDEMIEEF